MPLNTLLYLSMMMCVWRPESQGSSRGKPLLSQYPLRCIRLINRTLSGLAFTGSPPECDKIILEPFLRYTSLLLMALFSTKPRKWAGSFLMSVIMVLFSDRLNPKLVLRKAAIFPFRTSAIWLSQLVNIIQSSAYLV